MKNRRDFLRNAGLAILPGLLPIETAIGNTIIQTTNQPIRARGSNLNPSPGPVYNPSQESGFKGETPVVNFVADSELLSPGDYIEKLTLINRQSSIQADSY
ncbi:MAG: hypothetical protein EOO04_21280, partial [Chitinophagaceae bacterium]